MATHVFSVSETVLIKRACSVYSFFFFFLFYSIYLCTCICVLNTGFLNANCGLTCCLCNIFKILYKSRWVAEKRSDMSRLPHVSRRMYTLDVLVNTTCESRRDDGWTFFFFIKDNLSTDF